MASSALAFPTIPAAPVLSDDEAQVSAALKHLAKHSEFMCGVTLENGIELRLSDLPMFTGDRDYALRAQAIVADRLGS